jgi:3-phosphoshikimate 1-carboxyvinyltransferase
LTIVLPLSYTPIRMEKTVYPAKVHGTVLIPASKSHTIRALLIASMAEGESILINPLDSEDARSCIAASRALGAEVEEGATSEGRILKVKGTGGRIHASSKTIDVGNSGTTLYLASGLAALGTEEISFTGDAQIRSRPAGNLLQALEDLGASVRYEGKPGYAPFTIRGPLRGGKTKIQCPTSQYLSSLLLTTPLAAGDSEIEVPLLYEQPYVEMTLHWLSEQQIHLERKELNYFRIPGNQRYKAFQKRVPGDFSSATFFFCAAALTGSTLTLRGLDMNDTQGDKEVVRILERLGCSVQVETDSITLKGESLKGAEIDMNAIPDAFPALAATACYAEGTTRLINVPQARLKETDRIAVMAEELTKLGAKVQELPDGLEIQGKSPFAGKHPLRGGKVHGHGDHRIVMALALAALGAEEPVTIETAEAAAVTFPGFFELLESVSQNVL